MRKSGLLFGEIHNLASPVADFHVRVSRGPFGQFGLRAHQALHRCNVGENKAAFTAIIRCGCQTSDKKKFDHLDYSPVRFFCLRRLEHRLKSVNFFITVRSRHFQSIFFPDFYAPELQTVKK